MHIRVNAMEAWCIKASPCCVSRENAVLGSFNKGTFCRTCWCFGPMSGFCAGNVPGCYQAHCFDVVLMIQMLQMRCFKCSGYARSVTLPDRYMGEIASVHCT